MHFRNNKIKLSVISGALGLVAGLFLYGCQSAADPALASFKMTGPPPEKTGVQLWSENCSRCHNMRPPEEFSDAQWTAIVHHMRLRANLTGDEAKKITTFLQASN